MLQIEGNTGQGGIKDGEHKKGQQEADR